MNWLWTDTHQAVLEGGELMNRVFGQDLLDQEPVNGGPASYGVSGPGGGQRQTEGSERKVVTAAAALSAASCA